MKLQKHGHPYTALWSSLKLRPESVRVDELLQSRLDAAAQRKLTNIWTKYLRDAYPISKIINAVTPASKHNSLAIWTAALKSSAQQLPNSLVELLAELSLKIGEPPAQAIAHLLATSPISNGTLALVRQLPAYILREVMDKSPPPLVDDKQTLQFLVICASKGVFPTHPNSISTLKLFSDSSLQVLINGTTQILEQTHNASGVSTALCLLFIKHDSTQFIKALEKCRVRGDRPALTPTILKNLRSVPDSQLNTDAGIAAQALKADTLPSAYHNLSQFKDRTHLKTRLYANWLRCCARDTPQDLNRFYHAAHMMCPTDADKRVLLTGVVCGFRQAGNWARIAEYVPQIRETRTPFLWNLAVSACKDWQLVEEMHAKKIPVSVPAMKMLVKSGRLNDFLRLFEFELPTPEVVLAFLQQANASNQYTHAQLMKVYSSVFDKISGCPERIAIDAKIVAQVVWGSMRSNPRRPWQVLLLLKSLLDKDLVTTKIVADGLRQALEMVDAQTGTASHIRERLPMPVKPLITKFNDEWQRLCTP